MSSNARLKVLLNHIHQSNAFDFRTTSTSQFEYTWDNPTLSNENREFYEKNGYIVIRKLIEDEILDACRERFVGICEGRIPKEGMRLMKDITSAKKNKTGELLYHKINDILYDDVFSRYLFHQGLLDIVECFCGPNIKAMHSMVVNKPPDFGNKTSRHPLHQDLIYYPFRPVNHIVAAWTAMEPITVDNGCLFVLPGSHKGQLQPHVYPDGDVNVLFHGVRGYGLHPKVNLIMDKGDTVFFHPLLIHGSGVNRTEGFRKAISCHYASADGYYVDVRGTIQEGVTDEVVDVVKKRAHMEISINDFWEFRSVLVRGVRKTQ